MWDLLKYKNNTALIDENGIEISYSDVYEIQKEIARVLPGRCLVAALCSNTIGSVAGYISFVNEGVVPMLLSSQMEGKLVNNLLKLYSPEYIWCPESIRESDKELSQMQMVYKAYDYTLVRTGYEKKNELYDKLALLLTTSGSTGSPKFVRQSYDNIRTNSESIIEYLHIDQAERAISTLPMNYTYGLSIINTHIMSGASMLLTEHSLMQKEFWSFFREKGATSFGGVPYTYEMLDKLRFTRMDLPKLHTMTQAGGKLSLELHEKFANYASENGKSFVVMYGQCEATARMGYLPADMAVEKKGSMGIAIPGGKFTLEADDGSIIERPYSPGELIYEGANVTLGYAEKGEDLALGDERKGILHTGDMAQYDEDGYYYIVGRKKRFLKIYGNRVNLDETDSLIKREFAGMDCASTGQDDHMHIYITDETMTDKVKTFISDKTRLNPAAFEVRYIEEIPRNDSGKIQYTSLE